jgi:prepilin-type N-terminal cleavage/methylation domain-containing protein
MKKQSGFTLLEVMVATLVMGIAVVGVMSAISTSVHHVSRLTEYDRAVILARQKMDELLLARNGQPTVPPDGQWEPAQTGMIPMGWHAVITPFEMPPSARPPVMILERVQLEIWWMNFGERKTFRLEGYRQNNLLGAGGP